jgi:hypothetical protein
MELKGKKKIFFFVFKLSKFLLFFFIYFLLAHNSHTEDTL